MERYGVCGEESAELGAFLEVLEARVQHFFDAPELGAPQVAHVVETLVDCVEALVNCVEALVNRVEAPIDSCEPCDEKRYNKPDQRRIEQHWDADGKIELLVGHQS